MQIQQKEIFRAKIKAGTFNVSENHKTIEEANFPTSKLLHLLKGGFATYLLHTEARVASLLGHGFYTIGIIFPPLPSSHPPQKN